MATNNTNKRPIMQVARVQAPPAPKRARQQNPNRRAGGDGVRAVSAPLSAQVVSRTQRPQIRSDQRAGDLRTNIRHSEYVQDIAGSTLFALSAFAINPGLITIAPWLSQIARNYESYKFKRLAFEFRTARATSTDGKVFLAVDYNASDPSPSTKSEFLQERTKLDCPTWAGGAGSQMMSCDSADLAKFGPQRFVRAGAVPSGDDIKTFDIGQLFVATEGSPSTASVGELWIHYDVDLMTPSFRTPPLSAKIVGASVSNASTFGTTPTVTGSLPVAATVNTITFGQVGQYTVAWLIGGTTVLATAVTGTAASANLAQLTISTFDLATYSVNVTAPGQTLILNTSGNASTTSSVVRIGQYQTSLA